MPFSNDNNRVGTMLTWIARVFLFLNTAGVLSLAYWTGQKAQRVDDVYSRVIVIERRVEGINIPVLDTKLENVETRLRDLGQEINELRRVILDGHKGDGLARTKR